MRGMSSELQNQHIHKLYEAVVSVLGGGWS